MMAARDKGGPAGPIIFSFAHLILTVIWCNLYCGVGKHVELTVVSGVNDGNYERYNDNYGRLN